MAIKIKEIGAIAEKYGRVTPMRETDFRAGVTDPSVDWKAPTAAAADAYADGVSTAISEGRFARGVARAGTDKWRRKLDSVGISRWGPGVRAGVSDYESGFAPFRDTISGLTLSPKFKKGDPRNYVRSQEVGIALHEKKVRG